MKFIENLLVKSIYFKKLIGNRGTCIMKEDWDNLILLDGCRFDVFKNLNIIPGRLEYRISRGSCTIEFLIENFKGKTFTETVYVSGNPLVDYYVKNSFVDVVPVWKDGWNEELGTVLPDTMVKFSLKTNRLYPNKRLIIHFVQPHYPFIGKVGKKKIGKHEGMLSRNLILSKENTDNSIDHGAQEIWSMVKRGEIDKTVMWEAYEENLKIVLKHTKNLVKELRGRTVISSDHGNLFGEWLFPFPWKGYGHPCGVYKKNLIRVPWHIIDKGNKKKIIHSEKMKISMAAKKLVFNKA